MHSGLRSVILESLGFGSRDPLAMLDGVGGSLSSTVNGRKVALMVALMDNGLIQAGTVNDPRALLYSPDLGTVTIQRTMRVVKEAGGTNAGQTVWTPAAGKRFRLMGYILSVSSNAIQAAGGIIAMDFQDGGVNINHRHRVFVPAAAGPTGPPLYLAVVALPGNGYISTAANNVLALALTAALTGGFWELTPWGTEE